MKRSVLAMAIAAIAATTALAGEPKPFEGTAKAITFNNIDKKTQAYSSGIGYNGSTILTYHTKDNKLLEHNESLNYKTLYRPDRNQVVVWCDLMGEGMAFDYGDYVNMFNAFTSKPRKVMNFPVPSFAYNVKIVNDTLQAFGYRANFIRGRIENAHTGVDVEYEMIPGLTMPEAMRTALAHGFDADGMMVKSRFTSDVRAGLAGQLKSYQGVEITELNENPDLPDEIFECPKEIRVKNGGVQELDAFYKKIGKYLRKNKLFPDQTNKEVIYEVNEDEWAY